VRGAPAGVAGAGVPRCTGIFALCQLGLRIKISSPPQTIVRCRIDHTAAGEGGIELRAPQGQLEAWNVSDVTRVIALAEAAARRGSYAVGFVAYEAAPAFDGAFRVKAAAAAPSETIPRLPLAWFGLFAESVAVEPLRPPATNTEAPRDTSSPESPTWRCETDESTHAAGVRAIRGAIADGMAYLVNHTTRFRRPWVETEDPFSLYRQLVAGHSGGYHAYIETTDWAVACGSPELFFELSSERLTAKPMKGTAPRGRWAAEDVDHGIALQSSVKERAENVMVVDMLRNDMGRIAATGSVAVPQLWQVERHPSVWQLTSTVTATTEPDSRLADVFGALFPCASVTGAPKVSAMAIIADLEGAPRGVYCGAVGMIRPDPTLSRPDDVSARFAVGIRTAVVDKSRRVVEYGSGGGITWDSSPESEWEEVLIKTRALVDASPSAGSGHGLIETMGYHPHDKDGTVRNLAEHLARLASSADYFGFPAPTEAEQVLAKAVGGLTVPTRVRLVLHPDGTLDVTTSTLEDDEGPKRALQLCVDPEPIDSTDPGLFHKTTDRRRYEERAQRHHSADDVVLVNERRELTETTRANLAVCLGGQWCTPPLESGLLPGIERARLIASGQLVERVITLEDLRRAEAVATLSSLRGWRAAHICPNCSC
jgi:para-aminobenzoate synthetase / 4-amino-4-deoxychorismate lyase